MSKRKYPRSESIRNAEISESPMYVSWGGDETERKEAFREMGRALAEYGGYYRNRGGRFTDFSDLGNNISGRPGLTRQDYGYFRPDEATPRRIRDIIRRADLMYHKVGLIRNVIDLMGDFACQGIRLVHPNKRIERFYNNWWSRVHGKERSERFLNNLYRTGNVVLRIQTARINLKDKEGIFRSAATPDTKVERLHVPPREIPWRYVFVEPTLVEIVGGQLASFIGNPTYAIRLPEYLRRIIIRPKGEEERSLVAQLPDEIIRAAKTRRGVILDPEKTRVFHYKKDDWQPWAFPMIYAIMDDVILLEKLKLADMAALDGAISNVRVWKLGNLDAKIAPTRAAAAKLSATLENHVAAGTMDLVWGPDIELIESKTQVHQFLGEDKYKPTLSNIYAGLGIPPTLTGTFGAAGTTNNFISIKTLIQRLEYGRDVLKEFWQQEVIKIQKAIGFRFPAKIEFAWTSLGDEATEKALLIQMVDRNLISDELFQYYFRNDPEMERIRLNREALDRERNRMVPKSGPFYDPQFGLALKKLALQTMVMTPGEVGIRHDALRKDFRRYPKENGEKTGLEMRQPVGGPMSTRKKGQPQQGRPKNSKDTTKRKTKEFKPKSKAVVEIWANAAQVAIAEVLNPGLLEHFGKKNMRSLSAKEQKHAEKVKFGVLCNIEPLGVVDEETISEALDKGGVPKHMYATYVEWARQISTNIERKLTLDELRQVQVCVYTNSVGEDNVNNS